MAFDIEHGYMLFEKWNNGPFTDTDGTEALDIWLWENLNDIFHTLNDAKVLRRFVDRCKHYEQSTVNVCKSCGEPISMYCVRCETQWQDTQ